MAPAETILETRLVAAAVPADALARRFTVGGIVAKTLSAWWKHVLPFTALSAVVYAPFGATFGILYGSLLGSRRAPPSEAFPRLLGAIGAAWLVTVVLGIVQAGAITYGTVRHLAGDRPRLGEMLRAGVRRGLPVVGVGFLLWIAFAIGFLLLVVPAFVVMVATCVAIPAAVVERPGVLGAIRRSLVLTRGRRWALLGAGLTMLAIVWVLAAIVQVGSTAAAALLSPRYAPVAIVVASQLGNVLFSALPLVGISVAYHELRVEKEGVDVAALAKVFE